MDFNDFLVGLLSALVVVLIALPPRYDPAIRFKERTEAKRKRISENRKPRN